MTDTTRLPTHAGRARLIVAGLLAAGLGTGAAAQDAVDMAAAKKEGKVSWYTSTPIKQAQEIANEFEKATGIKVELFRSGGTAVLRRFQQEIGAGKVAADVLTTSDPAASNVLAEKGTFVAFKPKNFDKIVEAGKDKDGQWVGQRLNVMTLYARADKIAAADLPKTWKDVLDPKYKGKLVMTDPAFTSLQVSVVGMISKINGWGYYESLRKNDIMIVRSNQQVSDTIKRAERIIAVGALDSYAAADRKAGHDIVTVYPQDGTFIIPSPTAVVKGSPNPNAAKAFAEYMISDDAQKIFPKAGGYSARIDLEPPAGAPPVAKIKVIPVDYDFLEKNANQVKKKFAETFQ